MNVNLTTFYFTSCTFSGNSEMKYRGSDAKRLMLYRVKKKSSTNPKPNSYILKKANVRQKLLF